jgi:hypothetical protein
MKIGKPWKKGSRILAIFKNRFSSEELVQIFVSCSFPIHVWAIPNMLHDVPFWVLRFTKNELMGVVSYTLSFMLLESVFVFACILILGLLIPQRWMGRSIVPFSFVLLIELTLLAIALQYLTLKQIMYRRLLAIAAVLLTIVIAFAMSRIRRLNAIIVATINRLTPLTFIYIIADFFAVFVVFARNL